jgi:REP element-mobilizing transposase RayT
LADSLPQSVLAARRSTVLASTKRRLDEETLDTGYGECLLAEPSIAEIVQNALLHFDGERYRLHAWCVMPNHVHVLLTPLEGSFLSAIVHSWKSFTAHAINKLTGRRGRLWAEEYFDRAIRDDAHYGACKEYFENNPVTAGLCAEPSEWPFSSWGMSRQPEAETSAPPKI